MRTILHQYWAGRPMPGQMRSWCAGVRAWAESRGWEYHLWGREELEQRFAGEAETRLLQRCREVLPTATTEGLAGDWWRYRLLAEDGGMWLDTDFVVQDAARLNAWTPSADIACISEGWPGDDANICCLWTHCDRGREAARVVKDAASAALLRLLPIDAPDFAERYVQLTRCDSNRSGLAKTGIGPWRFRAEFLPLMREAGFTHEICPIDVAADLRKNSHAALVHWGSGAWRECDEDWSARKRAAVQEDLMVRLPAWLRPQGRVTVQPGKGVARSRQRICNPLADGLHLPSGVLRVVVFSNVPGLDMQQVALRAGDFCVHCNRAVHYEESRRVPGTVHALLVRHGVAAATGAWQWYEPTSTDGIRQVIHIDDAAMSRLRPWWRAYRAATGKCPTTGHIAWHLAREAGGTAMPIVLAGFAPGRSCGTPRWRGHAWDYEAEVYRRAGAAIIPPR